MNWDTTYTRLLGDLLALAAILLPVPAVLLHPEDARLQFSPSLSVLYPENHPAVPALRLQTENAEPLRAGDSSASTRRPFPGLVEPPQGATPRLA